jgi:hypothetical protein
LSVWLTRGAVGFPALVVALLPFAPAGDSPAWRTDLALATREAKAAGKDVLVQFAGDGGAGTAHAAGASRYDDAAFLRGVARRFVPVRLSVDTAAARAADVEVVTLAERLGVARVPSLVLMDADGRPYGAVEDDGPPVDALLHAVDRQAERRLRRDEAMARAAKLSGRERAKELDAALRQVEPFAFAGYEDVAREVVALDAHNADGLREKYIGPLAKQRIDRFVQSRVYPLVDRSDFAGALAAIDGIIADEKPPTEPLQTLTAFKGQLLCSMGRVEEGRRVLRDALAIAPTSSAAGAIRAAVERSAE